MTPNVMPLIIYLKSIFSDIISLATLRIIAFWSITDFDLFIELLK